MIKLLKNYALQPGKLSTKEYNIGAKQRVSPRSALIGEDRVLCIGTNASESTEY